MVAVPDQEVPGPVRVNATFRAVVSGVRRATVARVTPGCRVKPVNVTVFGPARVTVTFATSWISIVGSAADRTENVQPGPGGTHSTPVPLSEIADPPPDGVAVNGTPVLAVPSTVTVGRNPTPGESRVTWIGTAGVGPVSGTVKEPLPGWAA